MDETQYGRRMLSYIDALPESSVMLVYFNLRRKPYVVENLKVCTLPSGSYYINCGEKGLWVYTYKESDIKYLIYRHKTQVQGFIGTMNGGARFDRMGIGHHLTVGIEKLDDDQWMLTSHETNYIEKQDAKHGILFRSKRSPEYDFVLQDAFDPNQPLMSDNHIQGTIASAYRNTPHWIDVLAEIHRVYHGQQRGGGYIVRNGRRYKVHRGDRGGRYIVVNQKRVYICTHKQLGGAEELFQFLYDVLVAKVIQKFDGDLSYVDAQLLYDDGADDFVMMYDQPEYKNRQVFYLNIKMVMNDYVRSLQSVEAANEVQTKYDTIVQAHQTNLVVS